MTLNEHLDVFEKVFIDTAPFIYFIQQDLTFGEIAKSVFCRIQDETLKAETSVITLAEVIPRPMSRGETELVEEFEDLVTSTEGLTLHDISIPTCKLAGRLRAKYPTLKMMDALQVSTAILYDVDAFITNDTKLRKIDEVEILVLKDYL